MVPLRKFSVALALLVWTELASAQTVINSTFAERPQPPVYSDPNNWTPYGVPNNTADRHYNVTINPHYVVQVDTVATISNLTLGSRLLGLRLDGRSLTVTGTTDNQFGGFIEVFAYDDMSAVRFDAGTLTTFSNNVLSGDYSIESFKNAATLQFNGADISAITGSIWLYGTLSAIVDEFGNDALRNLARIESTARLQLGGCSVVTNAPFRNDGTLEIENGATLTTFTAAAGLMNFDSSTRTLTGGEFDLFGPAVELRFNGADIVILASSILLRGDARVADLAGNDGLRNLGRILPGGKLSLLYLSRTITGPVRNDGVLSLGDYAVCAITALANFDVATRALSGGTFSIGTGSQLKFTDADIVHNGASITISGAGMIQDLDGSDALRNFSDNLASGEFVVGNSTQFTAAGAFTNAGKIETAPYHFYTREFLPQGRFVVPAGFNYTQTDGTTINNGYLSADRVDIMGGSFSGRGTVKGDVTIKNAILALTVPAEIQGNLTLEPEAHFRYSLDFNDPKQITGKVTLAGTLEIDVPAERFISSTTLLTVLKSAMPLTGVFSNAPEGARIRTVDGKGSMTVSYGTTAVTLFGYQPEPPPAQLLNISSRAFLSATSDDSHGDRAVVIGGFIISGVDAKDVVVRGLGPSLSQYGLSPVLADPVLELHTADGSLIASNYIWRQNEAAIQGAGLAPGDDREAALRKVLGRGTYTVVLREKNGQAGHGLVEIYDLTQNTTSKLANLSTRGFTDADHLLIGGMIAGGAGPANSDIVVRALGPELQNFGIANALDDPTLEVRNSDGAVVGFNDDYSGVYPDPVAVSGLEPSTRAESAMYLSLPPGSYTAIVRPKANSSGVALFEFYDLRR